MYKNFKEYWEAKTDEFTLRGIDEASAYEIWTNACATLATVLLEDWENEEQ